MRFVRTQSIWDRRIQDAEQDIKLLKAEIEDAGRNCSLEQLNNLRVAEEYLENLIEMEKD